MSNSFFQFKQFIINQDQCAMKVCTDACILGAWAAERIMDTDLKRMLDIGSGTGLLSLMLAQKINAEITAIEIDPLAAKQATENIVQSAFAEKISVECTALQNYSPKNKFDLIICNPPFYEDDLRSADEKNNTAKHDTTLRLNELIVFVNNHLDDEGVFILLLPFHRTGYFEKLVIEQRLFVKEKLLLKQSPKHDHFRSILLIARQEIKTAKTNELVIHDNERNYTPAFKALLKDYYLKL